LHGTSLDGARGTASPSSADQARSHSAPDR
jgi:hypothetical protein